jgi:ceramide glucosyltransferase
MDVWKHQVRWSRTIRVSRPAGYFGYIVTQLTFWCVVTAAVGHWKIAIAGLAVRLIAAAASMNALGCTIFPRVVMVPLRDLFGLAVWAAGVIGREVEWRGLRFRLLSDGRIAPIYHE